MKLSIIVPVYNVEQYLVRCIESIVPQMCADYELILVDDGSTDDSGAYCDEFARKYASQNIVVIHQANGGLSAARNRGLDAAKGEYVTFVDSDDCICMHTITDNMKFLSAHPEVDMLEYPVEVHAGSADAYSLNFREETQSVDVFADWIRLEGYHHCYAWNKIYRSHLWKNFRFPVNEFYEDVAVMPHIVKHCRVIHYSSRGCYRYYRHEGSITTSYRYKKQRNLFCNNHKLYLEIKANAALQTESLLLWICCLNQLIDMGRCADADKGDFNTIVKETDKTRPAFHALLSVAPNMFVRIKLLPLLFVGLRFYCFLYVALTKQLKS